MRMEPVLGWNIMVMSNLRLEGTLTFNVMFLVMVRETNACGRHKGCL